MIYRIDVAVRAPVNPTEVTDRVVDAIERLVPGVDVERAAGEVRAEAHSLEHFSELLHEQAILDTARNELLAGAHDGVMEFALKKQPAFEGVVNFAVGETDELGEIGFEVRVHEPTLGEYLDYVAPPTEDGEPVEP